MTTSACSIDGENSWYSEQRATASALELERTSVQRGALLGPGDFGDVEVFGQLVQSLVEVLRSAFRDSSILE